MMEFWKLFGTACFGVCVGLLVQWWKSHRDEVRALCEKFCSCVDDAAKLGSEYWRTDCYHTDNDINEARLMGFQTRLDGYRVLVNGHLDERKREAVNIATTEFFDALTGGEFKSGGRSKDPSRLLLCQTKAAAIDLTVRQGFEYTVSLESSVRRLVQRIRTIFSNLSFRDPK